jgi:hypothetical protein
VCDTTYVEHYRVPNRLGYLKELHKRSKKKFLKKLNRDITLEGSEIVMTIDNRKRVTSVSGVREKDKFLKHLNKYYHATTTRIKGERIYTHYTLILKRNATGKVVDFTALAKPMDADGTLLEFAPYDIIYAERVICDYIDTTVSVERSVVHNDVITRVLDRNEQWKNCLVVTDVTGSMLPYMGQFLVWHQLNLKTGAKNIDFVLFNDGNNMKDALKVVGSTGGIYYIHTDKFHELKKEVNYAQHNGSGGDREENNIEAALYGIKMNPSASAIIMIADNNATPRDLELLSEVNKPIHVILCGAENGINVEYLDLVRKNGGSLHTIEDDIENLAAMNEGEEIEIEGRSYRIEDGKFVLLHDKTIAD